MKVAQAVAARRSVRGFLSDPVPVDQLTRLAAAAARAPSGGNLQPWFIDIVAGDAMARLKAIMAEKTAAGAVEAAAYDIYPRELPALYRDRRFAGGMGLYAAQGIAREDHDARARAFAANFQFFGAPAAIFCSVDRAMGPPQWSDLGMYLQSFMLLALAEGLATCAQECWAMYPQTVGEFLALPGTRMLFCGVAVGFEDKAAPANRFRATRAPEGEWLRVVE